MIKKFIVTLLFAGFALPVFAIEPAPVVSGVPVKIGEERQAFRAKVAGERAELKDRLAAVKDQRKKDAVQRAEKELAAANARMTAHFTNVLKQVRAVLGRINERITKAKEAGRDVSSVAPLVDVANAALAKADAAVVAQAAKTYTVTVTTEAGLRDAVRKAREALRADLEALRATGKAARTAVHDVAVALAQIPKPAAPVPAVNQ